MTVSKSARYALYAVLDMARALDEPVTVGQVAERYRIPESALAKVFQQLVRSGIAVGTRGIGGGYRLARPPRKVTVLDVMDVFERSRRGQPCLLGDPGLDCERDRACSLGRLFAEVDELILSTYASVTFETLVKRTRGREDGQRAPLDVAVSP